MARNRVGKIDTNTLLLIGGGVLAFLLLTKKTTATATIPLLPAGLAPGATPAAVQVAQQQTTQTAITAGDQALQSILDMFD